MNAIEIVRLTQSSPDALQLLQEYYEAIQVVQRDTPEALQAVLDDLNSGIWLAYLDGKAVGCVVLRRLPSVPEAGECKRLYVRQQARGRHLADALMDALEAFAREKGLRWVYLDSHDGLKPALALYEKRGYLECERFNDNPQATVFMRKAL